MSIKRFVELAALPVLVIGLGCASTHSNPSSEPSASEPMTHAVELKDGSGAVELSPVYFDTDRAELKPAARRALEGYGKAILEHPEWGELTIEGHCDERGSDEYNLALGRSRADRVRQYLIDLGVPRSRLDVRSFGEEQPAVAGHEESAWRYNRRSELTSDALQSSTR